MIFSNRGISVIGSLLGFSLLGLSTVGLVTYMGSFEEVKISYAQQSNVQFMHSELLGSMEKVMSRTSVKVTSNTTSAPPTKKQYGLCKIVTRTDNNNNSPLYSLFEDKEICPIMLQRSSIQESNDVGSYEMRLTYFIQKGENWEEESGDCAQGSNGFVDSFTEDNFNKCFKYKAEGNADSIYARVSIIPEKLPSFEPIAATGDPIPVDELAYKLKSIISVQKTLEPGEFSYSLSKSEKYFWGTDVLDCHVCSGTDCMLARFSSTAQGTAAKGSKVCYHSVYALKEQKDALEILVEKKPPEITKSGNTLSYTDTNDSASCRSNMFRCSNVEEKKDFDPTLNFRFLLNYDQVEDSYIHQMDLKVTDGSDNREYGTLFSSADQQGRVGRNNTGVLTSFGAKEWPLKAGSNEVKAFMADQNSSNSICLDICKGGAASYYPELTVKYGDSNCENSTYCSETLTASDRKISCYQCNMKSCHRRGVGTHQLDTSSGLNRGSEPSDAGVPECLVEETITATADTTQITNPSVPSRSCLKTAASSKLTTVLCQGGLNSPEFKEGTHKSACFSEGQTKVIEGGYGDNNAGANCLRDLETIQLAREESERGSKIWTSGVLPDLAMAYGLPPFGPGSVEELLRAADLPKESKNYKFDNYANFSAYLGDIDDLSDANVLVPYQRDAGGMFHSGWFHLLDEADLSRENQKNKVRWAYFYREPFKSIDFDDAKRVGVGSSLLALPSGVTRKKFVERVRPSRPIYIKMDDGFNPDGQKENQTANDVSEDADKLVLTHHLAFRGIRGIQTTSSAEYPYLCRNIKADKYKEAFALTTAQGAFNDGFSKCQVLGSDWYFIPPSSRKLWAAALQTVVPNAPRYPFPNPFQFPDGIPFWKKDTSGNKVEWSLSYKYEDLDSSSNEYLKSYQSDNEILFTTQRGVLVDPASAWVGGLKPEGTYSNRNIAGKSWRWKPDWAKLIGHSESTSNPSFLFDSANNTATLTTELTKLNDDTNFTNIGAINYQGRVMKLHPDLRHPDDLRKFKTNITRFCRYGNAVKELDFHKALIMVGTSSNWGPSDNCGDYTNSNIAKSFLSDSKGEDEIYFQVPSTPGSTGLANLTAADYVQVRKGLKTLPLLLQFHKKEGIQILNTDRFCRMWKREKKRRAVGNCVVDSWNERGSKVLTIGSVNHGYNIAKNSRKDASICHGSNLCGGVPNYYSRLKNGVTNLIPSYTSMIRSLRAVTYQCGVNISGKAEVLNRNITRKNELVTLETCATSAVTQATTANCVSAITSESSNRQAYTPPALASCSVNHPDKTYNYTFKSASDSRCWDVKQLEPESEVTYDSVTGFVGLKDTEDNQRWTKDADCVSGLSGTSLERLPDKCDNYYENLADLDDNNKLCDDESVVYATETCSSRKQGRRESATPNSIGSLGSPENFRPSMHSCTITCRGMVTDGCTHTVNRCGMEDVLRCVPPLPSVRATCEEGCTTGSLDQQSRCRGACGADVCNTVRENVCRDVQESYDCVKDYTNSDSQEICITLDCSCP